MKSVLCVYTTDKMLSTGSQTLIAVCTDEDFAFKLINEDAKEYDRPLNNYDKKQLREIYQTQCREENYLIKEVQLNEIL